MVGHGEDYGLGYCSTQVFRGVYRCCNSMAKMRALEAYVYHKWNARNKALFEEETLDIEGIIMKINILTLRCSPCNTGLLI